MIHLIDRLHESRKAVSQLPAVLLAWSGRVQEMGAQCVRMVEALRAVYKLQPQSVEAGIHWLPRPGHPHLRNLDSYQQHVGTAAVGGPFKVMVGPSFSSPELIPSLTSLKILLLGSLGSTTAV